MEKVEEAFVGGVDLEAEVEPVDPAELSGGAAVSGDHRGR